MDTDQTNQPPVLSSNPPEQQPVESPKPKFKLPVLIFGIIGLLALAGFAAAAYFFVLSKPTAQSLAEGFTLQAECELKTSKKCHQFKGFCQVEVPSTPKQAAENEKFMEECTAKIGNWFPNKENVSPSPTPPPAGGLTANWKVYQNQYFSIMFPPTWNVYEVNIGQETTTCEEITQLTGGSKKSYSTIKFSSDRLFLDCSLEGNTRRLELYFEAFENGFPDLNSVFTPNHKTIFQGEPAVRNIPPQQTGIKQLNRITFNHSGNSFNIFYNSDGEGVFDPLYDQILSTFTFTK